MKKYIFSGLLLTFVLTLCMVIPCMALSEKYQTVKVGLYYSSSAKTEVSVSSSGGFQAGYMNESGFVPLFSLFETTLSIKYQSASSVLVNGTAYSVSNGNFSLSPVNGTVNINGSVYRGGVEILPTANGNFTVINFVNINDYVAAVVGKEMSPSWNIEALKAQAICARTFAVASWNKHASYGFNLCGTQNCQAYLGVSGESESTIRAASETKDMVIKYDGKIIEALYSATNGGSSVSAKNVWGSDIPYLVAVSDPYDLSKDNPRASWTVKLTKNEIKSKLAEKSVYIGDITDFKVTQTDEFGRAIKVTFYGTNGTYDITKDSTRSFFGFYSQKYTITPPGGSSAQLTVASSKGRTQVGSYQIKGAHGTSSAPSEIWMVGSGGKMKHSASTNPGSEYIVNGSGWGHGVGMSQYGAKAMADQGFTYRDIISFYYKGVYIE